MTLQDHNTIAELINFYLEQHKVKVTSDTDGRFWFSTEEGSIDKKALHKLLISNAIDSQKKDPNIY